jgi:hypothetical protein
MKENVLFQVKLEVSSHIRQYALKRGNVPSVLSKFDRIQLRALSICLILPHLNP